MKKTGFILLGYLLFVTSTVCSQPAATNIAASTSQSTNKQLTMKWITRNPFKHDVFIENKGQFSEQEQAAVGEPIVYYTRKGKLHLYFSNHSVVFRYDSIYSINKARDIDSGYDEDGEIENNIKVKHCFFEMSFENPNPALSMEVNNQVKDYFTYGNPDREPGNTGIIAHGWKNLIYKDIYPGIDIEFYYPTDKGGLEYNIIVHPGADASSVKIKYSSNSTSVLSGNDVLISAPFMELIDHAPNAKAEDGANVDAAFALQDNILTFKIGTYDKNKTLIIDPWITTPLFTGPERAYDLDYDLHGNIYIYGGETPYYIEKLNSTGTILWTYTSSFSYRYSNDFSFFGGMCVDGHSGSSFISEGYDNATGGQMRKVNTLGVEVASWGGNLRYQELWALDYNSCQAQGVIIGGGTSANTYQTCNFDTTLVSMNPVQTVIVGHLDLSMVALDNSANCYIISSANQLIKAPLANLSSLIYNVPSGYSSFTELGSIFYVYTYGHYAGAGANQFHGLAINSNTLFGYDGATLRKWEPSNGNQISSKTVYSRTFQSGGLAVDDCNHLFFSILDTICLYDTNFNRVTTLNMPDSIYDLRLANRQLYACGPGFVAAANIAFQSPISVTYHTPSSCNACDGSATGAVNCGVGPFSYSWSNGRTTQTITGLCAGTYTLTVGGFSCIDDTAIIYIPGKPGYYASVIDTNPGCRNNSGNITLYPFGGTSPYTYSWSNGATTQRDTGLGPGTYLCMVTDHDGCKFNQTVTLVNASPVNVSVVPIKDSICPGSNISLTASGAQLYRWTPNAGLSCYNCPNPTASPTVSTTYTVVGRDTMGCNGSATVNIHVLPIPEPIVRGRSPVCTGFSDTLIAKGGTSYIWSNGATTDTIIVVATNETLTVTATNGICSHDTTFTIITDLPNAVITVTYDSVCSKAPDTLTASGGDAYTWEPGGRTSPYIVVTPTTTTTYTLSATDNLGGCVSTASVTIGIIKNISSAVHLSQDSICQGTSTSLDVISSGNVVFSYNWSTGATSTIINVTPDSTTTYYVVAQGKCNKDSLLKTVIVIPLPVPIISPLDSVCKGSNDTLTVTGGTAYLWSNGSTKNTYLIKGLKADSSITVIAYNYRDKKCKASETVNIPEKQLPSATVKGATVCAGACVILRAKPSGGGVYSYNWSTGATIDSIIVCPNADSLFYVTVFNGCKSPREAGDVQIFPASIFACCDTAIDNGNKVLLTASNAKSFVWTPSSSLSCDTCRTVTATPSVTTTYTVNGVDTNGCKDVATITVIVDYPCFDFIIPNVFTPNGDGINDDFIINTKNLNAYFITIYDRWGKEMYKSSDPTQSWNGNTEGGAKASDGVYYYIITSACQGKNIDKQGFVQLIR